MFFTAADFFLFVFNSEFTNSAEEFPTGFLNNFIERLSIYTLSNCVDIQLMHLKENCCAVLMIRGFSV